MAKLVHTQSGKVIGEYPLVKGSISIGRSKDSDIRLEDITVSGCHAVVEVVTSEYMDNCNDVYLIDQHSTNGTIINGRHVKRHLMKHGEMAVIGQNEFSLIDEESLSFERTMVFIPENKQG